MLISSDNAKHENVARFKIKSNVLPYSWNFIWFCVVFDLQELKESFNYGLFCPPSNGKAGKFLDEERRLGDYPFNGPVGYLEVHFCHGNYIFFFFCLFHCFTVICTFLRCESFESCVDCKCLCFRLKTEKRITFNCLFLSAIKSLLFLLLLVFLWPFLFVQFFLITFCWQFS